MCTQKNFMPNEWRSSVVILIFKEGDRKDPKNYRGISMLNTCYKTSSKILIIKLQSYSVQFLPEMQNEFRKGYSGTDAKF